MMKKRQYHSLDFRRLSGFVVMCLFLFAGLGFYIINQIEITNFKPYYAKAHIAAAHYKVTHFKLQNKAAAAELGTADSVPVLLYHGIVGKPDGHNVTIDSFIEQMTAFKEAGYQTISINDYLAFIHEGKPLPKKSFLLTFDDGRKDSYYPVDTLLRALGYRATMYVVTGESFVDQNTFHLTTPELKDMKKSGRWDLQVHTHDGHSPIPIDENRLGRFYSNKKWLKMESRLENDQEYAERVEDDLRASKESMKSYMGIDSPSFAAPFGDIGQGASNYQKAQPVLAQKLKENYATTFIQYRKGLAFSQNYRDNSVDVCKWRVQSIVAFAYQSVS